MERTVLRQGLTTLLLNPAVTLEIITSGRSPINGDFRIPERTIPEHLMHFVEARTMEYIINGRSVSVSPDHLLWIQPGVPHAARLAKGSPPALVSFYRFALGRPDIYRLHEPFLLTGPDPSVKTLVHEMLPRRHPQGETGALSFRYLLGALMCRLLSEGPETNPNFTEGLSPVQRRRAVDYIQRRLTQRFTLSAMARDLGLNPDYFSRQFKKSFGMPPQEWIKRERTRQASLLLLESASSLTDIALSLGYEDIYFFSRQFKQVMGMSPRKYRFLRSAP